MSVRLNERTKKVLAQALAQLPLLERAREKFPEDSTSPVADLLDYQIFGARSLVQNTLQLSEALKGRFRYSVGDPEFREGALWIPLQNKVLKPEVTIFFSGRFGVQFTPSYPDSRKRYANWRGLHIYID